MKPDDGIGKFVLEWVLECVHDHKHTQLGNLASSGDEWCSEADPWRWSTPSCGRDVLARLLRLSISGNKWVVLCSAKGNIAGKGHIHNVQCNCWSCCANSLHLSAFVSVCLLFFSTSLLTWCHQCNRIFLKNEVHGQERVYLNWCSLTNLNLLLRKTLFEQRNLCPCSLYVVGLRMSCCGTEGIPVKRRHLSWQYRTPDEVLGRVSVLQLPTGYGRKEKSCCSILAAAPSDGKTARFPCSSQSCACQSVRRSGLHNSDRRECHLYWHFPDNAVESMDNYKWASVP